jgi:FKBP-type peptidyl-prolyl cis-trans isomerase FklB
MKKLMLGLCALLLLSGVVNAEESFKSEREKSGYAIGMNLGMNIAASMNQQQVDIAVEQLAAGFRDAVLGDKTMLTEEEMQQTLMAFQLQMQQEMQTKNAAASEAFLVENAKQEGVVSLPSGLQYRVLTSGDGAIPGADSNVSVHYRGTLIDGTEFDSSYSRGAPASFQVNGVIAGWTEALQLMKEGDKWQLAIPSQLAYGERGSQTIPPNSALIFEVELLKVN